MTHIERRATHARTVTITGRDASGKEITETVTVVPKAHAWYEYAGAEIMALDLGIVLGAIATRLMSWQQVIVIGVVGFVLACGSIWGASLWYQVRLERVRRIVPRGTSLAAHDDVPPEHRRQR